MHVRFRCKLSKIGTNTVGIWSRTRRSLDDLDVHMVTVKDAAKIAKLKYPSGKYTVTFIFDRSICYRALSA